MNTVATKEIWKTTTTKGSERFWTFSRLAFRALPVKRAEAELGLATGTHRMIAKPGFVGK